MITSRLYTFPSEPKEIRALSPEVYLTRYNVNYWQPEKVNKILMWTPFFNEKNWAQSVNSVLQLCPEAFGRCEMTANRLEVYSSSAVLFHADDFWKIWFLSFDKEWKPTYRHPRQVWVMMSHEPTTLMWGWFPPDMFNWTMTYRRDSTIPFPIGLYVKKTQKEVQESLLQNMGTINYFGNKTKMAVIHVSNCPDNARRYRIVKELSKYLEVDEYGHCSGKVVCDYTLPLKKCSEFFQKYKFYLAFENSICRDYTTEKYWHAQTIKHQIPVVAASNSTLSLLPPKSYLNLFDFPTVKDLADEMLRIGNNATLFNSFFEWQKYYKPGPNSFCTFCKALHENRTAQSYHDMEAWIKHDTCSKPTVSTVLYSVVDNQINHPLTFPSISFFLERHM